MAEKQNAFYNTIFLTYLHYHYEEIIQNPADTFCHTHPDLITRYRKPFERQYIAHTEEEFFFEDVDRNFLLILCQLLSKYPEILKKSEPEIRDILLVLISKYIKSESVPSADCLKDYLSFIEILPFESSIKWKMIALFVEPHRRLQTFLEIYKLHLPAYESVANTYEQLKESSVKQTLLNGFKLLSDKSKLEILCLLKTGPKYNLEIAEQLHLTPPTMSHHMSRLLAEGFVDVKKEGGKVYYSLSPNKIEEMMLFINKLLL